LNLYYIIYGGLVVILAILLIFWRYFVIIYSTIQDLNSLCGHGRKYEQT